MDRRFAGGVLAGCMAAVLAVAGVFLAGCETAETGADAVVLLVSPQVVNIEGASTSFLFTVTAQGFWDTPGQGTSTSVVDSIFLPLKWTVSNEALGKIAGATGNQAMYVSVGFTNGQNIVTVRDQVGSEGLAIVNQKP